VRLKLDENLGIRCADLLRSADHDVTTVAEQKVCSSTDEKLLEKCKAEKRCLVTLDMEFANPLIFDPVKTEGIAVLRLPPKPTPDDFLDTIRTLIGGLSQKEIRGRLWTIQRGRIREYQPEEG